MMRWILTSFFAGALAFACSANDGTPRPLDSTYSDGSGCGAGDCGECATCVDSCLCAGTAEALCVQHCGGGDTSSGGSGAGGGGNPTAGAGGGEQVQPSNCEYPTGQTGVAEGKVLRKTLQWQGFLEGSTQQTTIKVEDYLDCDGTKGINALLLTTGALWCGNCNQEASEFDRNMANKWEAMGIKILSLIIEDSYSNPATIANAQQWRSKHGGQRFAVGVDPAFSFAQWGENGLPTQLVVDPRTMQIVYRQEGYSPSYPSLEGLAQRNAQ